VKKAKELGLPENFYNYLECPEPESDGETFPWERKNGALPEPVAEKPVPTEKPIPTEPDVKPATTGFSFNFNSGSPKHLDAFGSITGTGQAFSGGFGGFKNAGQTLFSNDAAADTGNANGGDDECNVAFKPVLDELPPEIEITTGLENDEEIFSHRAKLFRFARETSPPEWKERGLGDIKITQNIETKVKYRRSKCFKLDSEKSITKFLKSIFEQRTSIFRFLNKKFCFLKFQFLNKTSIFEHNFNFFNKTSIFEQKFLFFEISIFEQNLDFLTKLQFLTKLRFSYQTFVFLN